MPTRSDENKGQYHSYHLNRKNGDDFHLENVTWVAIVIEHSLCHPNTSLVYSRDVRSLHIYRVLEELTTESEALNPLQQRHIQLIPLIIECHPMIGALEVLDRQSTLGVRFEWWLV